MYFIIEKCVYTNKLIIKNILQWRDVQYLKMILKQQLEN